MRSQRDLGLIDVLLASPTLLKVEQSRLPLPLPLLLLFANEAQ